MIKKSKPVYELNDVFVAGGQPTVTFVERGQLGVIDVLKRAVMSPNCIVSVTGATKSGKTVLVRNVLSERQYVLVEGGQCKTQQAIFDRIASELNFPFEEVILEQEQGSLGASATAKAGANLGIAKVEISTTPSGSRIKSSGSQKRYRVDNTATALRRLIQDKIVLIIDDFHYIEEKERSNLIRSLKGAIFQGLKVILLSVGYRAYEALNAEREMTGRLIRVNVPDWDTNDLKVIATKGFESLGCQVSETTKRTLASEANGNPLLMQKFCWELCANKNIHETQNTLVHLDTDIDLETVFKPVAADCGQPIFEKLVAGPQSRSERMSRPLKSGGHVDIYQALFKAIKKIGAKTQITYEEIRSSLSDLLAENVPQKHEVSNALRHIAKIALKSANEDAPIEWDEEGRTLFIQDPFLRFYLKWAAH